MSSTLIRIESTFGPMLAHPDDLITRQLLEYGAHTRPELAFFLSVVRAGDRAFDLGAHIGSFTVPLAQRVGATGRVVAVEAVHENFLVAAQNVALNGLSDRIDLRCALVAPSNGFQAVPEAANTAATFFKPSPDVWGGEVVSIDSLALRTFVPDVIKIDIEGLEAWALTTSEVVKERKPVLYAEIVAKHLARSGASVSDIGDVLRELGYRLFRHIGARNAAHDEFEPLEIGALDEGGLFFDVLAIHKDDDERLKTLARQT